MINRIFSFLDIKSNTGFTKSVRKSKKQTSHISKLRDLDVRKTNPSFCICLCEGVKHYFMFLCFQTTRSYTLTTFDALFRICSFPHSYAVVHIIFNIQVNHSVNLAAAKSFVFHERWIQAGIHRGVMVALQQSPWFESQSDQQ